LLVDTKSITELTIEKHRAGAMASGGGRPAVLVGAARNTALNILFIVKRGRD
jgi:hypothetical protein